MKGRRPNRRDARPALSEWALARTWRTISGRRQVASQPEACQHPPRSVRSVRITRSRSARPFRAGKFAASLGMLVPWWEQVRVLARCAASLLCQNVKGGVAHGLGAVAGSGLQDPVDVGTQRLLPQLDPSRRVGPRFCSRAFVLRRLEQLFHCVEDVLTVESSRRSLSGVRVRSLNAERERPDRRAHALVFPRGSRTSGRSLARAPGGSRVATSPIARSVCGQGAV